MNVIRPVRQFCALGIMLGLTVFANGQVIPIDDFDDRNDDGWTHVDTTADQPPWGPGIYDASSQAYVLRGMAPSPPDNPTDGALFSLWDTSSDPLYSNGLVRLKTRVNEKNSSAFLMMRADLSTFSGHVFAINTELDNFRFFLQSFENFMPLGNVSEVGPLFEPDQDWMLEAGAVGGELSLKYWKVDDPVPSAPQLTFPDMIGAAGQIAVGASFPGDHNPESLVNATFDDIVFIVPEPASVALVLVGLVGLLALRR